MCERKVLQKQAFYRKKFEALKLQEGPSTDEFEADTIASEQKLDVILLNPNFQNRFS